MLTQLAADLFHRVPDPTGGLKDPLVGIVDGVSHGKRESVKDWFRKAIQRAEETRSEEAAKEAKSKSRSKPLKGGGTQSGSIL